jgi:glutaredoxin-like YruB-family protein
MKAIESLKELKFLTMANESLWLLLYRQGSAQSDDAVKNILNAGLNSAEKNVLCSADVANVRDIHPAYGIKSVPALLHFVKGKLRNVVKGCHTPAQYEVLLKGLPAVRPLTGVNKVRNRVTVYTTPHCSWCTTIKRHFKENGILFHEVDVSANQKAAEEMVQRSGRQGVPQTDINGEIIVGFDKTRINTLLGLN